ncbi:GNAT family N-acetyltransferase [Acetobacterium sp.]|jgi:ribosomal protein S18 acetylase RimI-like enzyme|uniref:GNAT family N-acetyltransferase n=1 Tax=Acetobacterium sp. TaxID=1872094 RepID=UPI00272053AB|nr:GNAT family N-acetyltransferase [Acetobacterium sp.]MDO9490981.1 GNAT family N-acetyltransferase [Acetobacterium sp.]
MIKKIDNSDLEAAVELANAVFHEFIADGYSAEGRQTFTDYLDYKLEEMAEDLATGHKKLWGFYEDKRIVGVIGTRDDLHISVMFVDKNYHHRGIARALFDTVLADLKSQQPGKPFVMTVNSSPYAVAVYRRFGFVDTAAEQVNKGIRFVPMKLTVN